MDKEIEQQTDIAVIGAGPIGIEMAATLQKSELNYLHFEAGNIGSTISWYAPETPFFSSPERIAIAGVPLGNQRQTKATREEYLTYLRLVVSQYQLPIRTFHRLTSATPTREGFVLNFIRSFSGVGGPQESEYAEPKEIVTRVLAQKVVLAIGDMHSPNYLGIPGEKLSHVSHYFEEPHQYFGSRVLIVGGNNSAVEAAIRLARLGAKVVLSYRRSELNKVRIKPWLYPDIKYLIRSKQVEFLPNTIPLRILKDRVTLAGAEGEENKVELEIPVEHVLLLTGYKQDKSLFKQFGLSLLGREQQPELDSDTMESTVSGVYVAGTAVAGTQLDGVTEFIETSHVHVERIANHLLGWSAPKSGVVAELADRES